MERIPIIIPSWKVGEGGGMHQYDHFLLCAPAPAYGAALFALPLTPLHTHHLLCLYTVKVSACEDLNKQLLTAHVP